ncbi:MAG TPA: DUF1697 domain-containing protein [Terracidiphilus sp.]
MKYVALLRGINVGGSGLLPMKDLTALCEALGFADVRTYIQSGNVLFESKLQEARTKKLLEDALEKRMGKKISVMVRTGAELDQILAANPFADKEPAKVGIAFLNAAPPDDLLWKVVAPDGEQVQPGAREIYVYYPIGMGRSKLKLRALAAATVRNANTLARLAAMCGV